MSVLFILVAAVALVLGAWCLAGTLTFFLYTHSPKPGSRLIVRTADRRWCLAGDQVDTTLHLSSVGLPPKVDEEPVPMDVVLVADVSVSMGAGPGSPLELAKQAMASFVRSSRAPVRVGVVTFDHGAEVVSELTLPGNALLRRIATVSSGGGTSIAAGLDRATELVDMRGQGLLTDGGDEVADPLPAPRTRQVVVLLSDGESSRQDAIAVSQRLKDAGVTVVAISLGYSVDRDLMRDIASEGMYFHRADASELVPFYGLLAQSLREVFGTDVEVEESLSRDDAGLALVGSTGQEPLSVDLAKSKVYWHIPHIASEVASVGLQHQATRPGWYPLAPERARVSMKDANGNPHEASSERTPWILVLPDWPLWPLWWVLLNPLFWMVFGGMFGRGEARPQIGTAGPPKALPGPALPSALARDLPQPVHPELAPALVIGVGYLGRWVLTHLRASVVSRLGAQSEGLVLRHVDTASPAGMPEVCFAGVRLADNETLSIGRDLRSVLLDPGVDEGRQWVQRRRKLDRGVGYNVAQGSLGDRAMARLALLEASDDLDTFLADAVAQVSGPAPEVVVVSATGGGTSSGMLSDVCMRLRRQLVDRGLSSVGVTVLLVESVPDPVARANTRSLLAELARFNHRRDALAESTEGGTVSRWMDRVMVVRGESGAGPGSRVELSEGRAPGAAAEAADVVLAWLASPGLRATFGDLAADELRWAAEHCGGLGHRIGCQSVRLPTAALEHAARSRAALKLVAARLLGAHADRQGFVLNPDVNLVREALTRLFRGGDALPARPWVLQILPDLASQDRFVGTIGGSSIQQISSLGVFHMQANHDRTRVELLQLLAAWVARELNGDLADDDLASVDRIVAARGARLGVVSASLHHIERLIGQALGNLATFRSRSHSLVGSLDHVGGLLLLVRQLVRRVAHETDEWVASLVTGRSVPVDMVRVKWEVEGLCRHLEAELKAAEAVLEDLASTTRPRYLTASLDLDRMIEEVLGGPVELLLARLHWHVELDESENEVSLQLGVKRGQTARFSPNAENLGALHGEILALLAEAAPVSWADVHLGRVARSSQVPDPGLTYRPDGLGRSMRGAIYVYDSSQHPLIDGDPIERLGVAAVHAKRTDISPDRPDPHWSTLVTMHHYLGLGDELVPGNIDLSLVAPVYNPEARALLALRAMEIDHVGTSPLCAETVGLLAHEGRLRTFVAAALAGKIEEKATPRGSTWAFVQDGGATVHLCAPGGQLVDAARRWVLNGRAMDGTDLPVKVPFDAFMRWKGVTPLEGAGLLLYEEPFASRKGERWVADLARVVPWLARSS